MTRLWKPRSFIHLSSYPRLENYTEAPFVWRKLFPGRRVTLPAESTLESGYMRKKVDPFAESTALTNALIVSFWPSWLGWASQSVGETLAWLRAKGHQKRMKGLSGSPFWPSKVFVSRANGSPRFVRKCLKSWLAQGSSDGGVTLPLTSIYTGPRLLYTLLTLLLCSSYKSNQIKSNHSFIVPFAVGKLNCRIPYKLRYLY